MVRGDRVVAGDVEGVGRVAWPGTVGEALEVQAALAERAVLDVEGPAVGDVGRVAGVDVSYDKGGERLVAAAVVLDAGTLEPLETVLVEGVSRFPYVPGLLAFRELPSVMEALERVKATPDLIVCDGYGIAHPRRAGLAVHLGVLTGLPCFGVAKAPFVFEHEPPGPRRGDSAPLTADGGEVVGRALRTQEGVKPVFVSVGGGIGLDRACVHALRLAPRYRLPETTRWADRLSRARLREVTAGAQPADGPGGGWSGDAGAGGAWSGGG
ncbi:endonuclease V [Actinacidiphila sp. DG2A-62]|uniref:endonuclease V n=1 Tax=Actinacidiphila sp. DG2A-62 TaxID=3108821 RepID=UPI002DBBD9C1|nr:endonuclease V [Actinacidiphila sp. DG2A-62]MEC3994624.1 endonuclease V [Actinacidiphila sp. DG2A-62]